MRRKRTARARGLPRRWSLLLLGLALAAGCEEEPEFRVVAVRAVGGAVTSWDFLFLDFGPTEEGGWAYFPLVKGDVLGTPEQDIGFWPTRPDDPDSLELTVDGKRLLLNGKPVVLTLGEQDAGSRGDEERPPSPPQPGEGWSWLEGATPEEMASLRTLGVAGDLPPGGMAALEKLAAHNPTLSLAVDSAAPIPRMLSLFDPEILWVDGPLDPRLEGLFPEEQRLETVFLVDEDSGSLEPLRQIPNLKKLWLALDLEAERPLPDSLPSLEAITLFNPDSGGLNHLGAQPHLKGVTLVACSEPVDLRPLARYPHLEAVRIRDCGTEDISPLDSLTHLRWLGLSGVGQEQLEHVVRAHPDLRVLELLGSEELTDLTPLTRLKKLEGLMVGANAPITPLLTMDRLEYLGVDVDGDRDPSFGHEALPRLRAALPNTAVGTVDFEHFCLGSGYILLLLPLVAGAWWWVRGRQHRGRPARTHG